VGSRDRWVSEPGFAGGRSTVWYPSGVDALLKSSIALEAQRTPGQRLAEALEMMDWGIRMKRQRLIADHPTAMAGEIDAMLSAWLSGDD
jgi:hypothetical protein